jgi:hypothetical protein
MATLYARLSGVGLIEGEGGKIAIHSFIGALYDFQSGYLTGQQVVQIYNLDAAQTTQAQALKDLIAAAPNKALFMRVFKNCLYMAESGDYYLTQPELIARLQAEVTDQGGTLP